MGSRRLSLRSLRPLAFVIGLACGDSSGPDGYPALSHDPILFVHGANGSAGDFAEMRARFQADGWREGVELFAFDYSSTVTNVAVAQDIRNNVKYIMEKTGAGKVDIVAHEMGSLSSRFYIRHFAGLANVDAWVSLGGPNHGTTRELGCTAIPCQEMVVGSAFLAVLNAEVEGPPPPRYATWASPCDERVEPRTSPAIWDAANYVTSCLSNADLLRDAGVYAQVKTFVQ